MRHWTICKRSDAFNSTVVRFLIAASSFKPASVICEPPNLPARVTITLPGGFCLRVTFLRGKRSQVQIRSARLSFRTSPSSFSTVGFLHGITDFSARTSSSNGVPFGMGCRSKFAASRLPASDIAGSKSGLTDEFDFSLLIQSGTSQKSSNHDRLS